VNIGQPATFISYKKYDLPQEIGVSKLQSTRFENIIKERNDLVEIDSIVLIEIDENNNTFVRIKANAIVWILSKIKPSFLLLKVASIIFPFVGNCLCDLAPKYRQKAYPIICPIPPEKIRKILLD
jgi:hypothetical protein